VFSFFKAKALRSKKKMGALDVPHWSLFVLLIFANNVATQSPETEFSLVRAYPDRRPQVDTLQRLRFEKKHNVMFWRSADWPGRHADVWVPKSLLSKFTAALAKSRVSYNVEIDSWNVTDDDVTMEHIDQFDGDYRGVKSIYSELKRLARAYADRVKLIEIGHSFENRTIYGLQIMKPSRGKKPLIFVQCGIHGREWLSISSCMYVIRMMIFNDEYETDIQIITNNFEVVFIPIYNPDGYAFTWTKGGRFWRKTRSKTTNSNCPGVDLNRNYGFRWGGSGASPDVCDETYSGWRPFSEKESRAVAKYLYKRRNDAKVFVDVHTFGQILSHPWGFSKAPSFHDYKHREVTRRIANRIRWGNRAIYNYGQTSSTLYETSGDSTDWAYGFLGIVHSYGLELRPRLNNRRSLQGFNQTAKQIIPCARDLFMVINELAKYVYSEGHTS